MVALAGHFLKAFGNSRLILMCLEMRAILLGVKHQIEKLGFADKRIVQLSDSFVLH